MSVGAIDWALKRSGAPSIDRLVLVALANYADDDGYCWPKQETLAHDTDLSERAVRKHLRILEDLGLIRREKRKLPNGRRTSDGIWLLFNKPATDQRHSVPEVEAPPAPEGQGHRHDVPVDANSSGASKTMQDKDLKAPGAEKPPARGSAEPSIESSMNRQAPAAARASDPDRAARAGPADGNPDVGDAAKPMHVLWKERKQAFDVELRPGEFRRWFTDAIPLADDGQTFVLAVPSRFRADWINNNFSDRMRHALGRREVRVKYHRYASASRKREIQ